MEGADFHPLQYAETLENAQGRPGAQAAHMKERERQGLLQKSKIHHEELEWLAWSAAALSSGLELSCAIQARTVAGILQNIARLGPLACAETYKQRKQ